MDPASVPVMEPPPGMASNFVNPNSQGQRNIILHAICLTLVTLFMIMRFYTRRFITGSLAWDDYMCLVSYAMAVVDSALFLSSQHYGLGRHLWDVQEIHFVKLLKFLFVAELQYCLIVAIIKLTILRFFQRIFAPNLKMKYFTYIGMSAVAFFYLIIFFFSLFLCDPLQKAYMPSLPGHCRSKATLPYSTGIFNIISDFYILFLPLPLICNLHLQTSRKLRLIAIFSMGLLACVASTIRLAMTIITIDKLDISWNFSTLAFWAIIEMNVGIICACSLVLPAFLDRHSSHIVKFISSSFSSYTRNSKSNSSAGGRRHHPTFAPDRLRHHGHASKADRYLEFDIRKPGTARIMISGDGPEDTVMRATVGTGGPVPRNNSVEDWAADGIVRTVDLEQNFSTAVQNVKSL